jgi:hypothetical protein
MAEQFEQGRAGHTILPDTHAVVDTVTGKPLDTKIGILPEQTGIVFDGVFPPSADEDNVEVSSTYEAAQKALAELLTPYSGPIIGSLTEEEETGNT